MGDALEHQEKGDAEYQMNLEVRKIYIDSRFLVSGDSSAFHYELPEVPNLNNTISDNFSPQAKSEGPPSSSPKR